MSSRPFTRACKRRSGGKSDSSHIAVDGTSGESSSTIKRNIVEMTPMAPALLPLLDDVTSGLVASFLPARDLGMR